jgi:hypothetical protein
MPIQAKIKTIVQVILPEAMLDKHRWTLGTELNVAETPSGVLLIAPRCFATTRFEDVLGCLGRVDRTIFDEDIREVVLAEARRRYARA